MKMRKRIHAIPWISGDIIKKVLARYGGLCYIYKAVKKHAGAALAVPSGRMRVQRLRKNNRKENYNERYFNETVT